MANQYRHQQQYYRSDWYEEREDHNRTDYIRRRTWNFSEHYEDLTEERFQEVYDWETMHLNDLSEQEQLYELQRMTALEQLSFAQDQVERSNQLQKLQALKQEKQKTHRQASENDLTLQSLDSISYHMEQMQRMDDMHQSREKDGTKPIFK